MPALQLEPTKKNRIKAQGLVEILIAMTIFAVAVITITSMNAHNFKVIKNNELTDQANKVMLGALEYFKSPAQDVQSMIESTNVPVSGIVSFYLDPTKNNIDPNTGDALSWTYNSSHLGQPFSSVSTCNGSSINLIHFKDASGATNPFVICLQVDVTRQASGYQITSKIMYTAGGQSNYNSIIGFRPITYVSDTPAP